MKVIRHTDADFPSRLQEVAAPSSLFDAEIEQRTRAILEAVHARGDEALLEFTERFDGAKLSADQLVVTQAELMTASLKADETLRAAVTEAERNIATFAKKSKRRNWESKNSHGAKVGEKFDAFQRVGIYIPGGTAPLVSTALMTITLAKVAGCKEIVVCTPCGKDGAINSALLFAARAAGATEIYRLGGAQAIAAMAYGTKTIRRVQKIFGPGNVYVVTAKRLLVGYVAIDLLPGPSEVLVLADETANAKFAAADLLAQAEHGSGHERVWLITTSAKILRSVESEIAKQLPKLARRGFIQRVLDHNTWLIQVKTIEDGVALTNQLAPEHCEVMTRNPRKLSESILTAGAIFLGPSSPTVLGDYVAGPSHTLPTGGAGASFAGLTVDQFQRRTSVVEYNAGALKKALPAVKKFAEMEGLGAHGRSAEIRKMKSARMDKARNAKIMALLKKGQALFFSKPPDSEGAIEVFHSITELVPNWAEGFNWLGSALEQCGRLTDAVKMFRKGSQLDPKDSRPVISLGNCFVKMGRFADAVSSFRSGLELKPHYGEADARLLLGDALERMGKIQEAIIEWRRIAEMEAVYPSGEKPMIEAKAKLAQHKIEIR